MTAGSVSSVGLSLPRGPAWRWWGSVSSDPRPTRSSPSSFPRNRCHTWSLRTDLVSCTRDSVWSSFWELQKIHMLTWVIC